MSTTTAPRAAVPAREPIKHSTHVGPIGRLGRYTATHFRTVLIGWLVVAVVLGFFAPRVETALSGAGWEASGSQSVQARKLVERDFAGLGSYGLMTVVYSPTQTVGSPAFKSAIARVEQTLRANAAVRTVVAPAPGLSISRDGHTAIVQAGAARNPNEMVAAADSLKGTLHRLSTGAVVVNLTGAAGMWSDFNAANRSAMLKSEVISWPVTLGIMLLAFGSLVAAGLPLMLTMVGLLAAAGTLYLGTLIMPISIWAMNFALMFALALGIDYALFIVMRFRGAFFGSKLDARGGHGRDDGHGRQGRPVQRRDGADLAHRGDARPEPGLPQHEPRDHARRHLRARRDAHAAAGGAGQARPEGRQPLAAVGALRRAPLRRGSRPGASACGATRCATGSPRWSCCSRSPTR